MHIFQKLGQSGIQQRIREAFESCEQLWRRLIKYPCLRMLVSYSVSRTYYTNVLSLYKQVHYNPVCTEVSKNTLHYA